MAQNKPKFERLYVRMIKYMFEYGKFVRGEINNIVSVIYCCSVMCGYDKRKA